jgi:hypothetical protein
MNKGKYFSFSIVLLIMLLTLMNNITVAQTVYQQDGLGAKAQNSLQISSVDIVQLGDNPLLEIKGNGFTKDTKVMINDNGVSLVPQQIKKKKILVPLPSSSLCTGIVSVRVLVGTSSSNSLTFNYQAAAPVINSVSPSHAQPGAVIELSASNVACQAQNNLVTLNDSPVSVLSVNMDKMTVRVPETFSPGKVNIRVTVGSQSSLATGFTVDTKEQSNNNPNSNSDNTLRFVSTPPMVTSFAPMFAIRDKVNGVKLGVSEAGLWDVNFYGTHQAIIDLPLKIEGFPQKGLLTINFREVNGVFGNPINQKERFIYALVSFPRNPEKLYNPETNPFFWGACFAATESIPGGGMFFNSVGIAVGGVDSFEITKDASVSSKASMTFRLIAPDLGYYEDYGINYAAAGNGKVKLPKVMNVTVDMKQIDPAVPTSKFVLGKVIFSDFANGSMTTDNPTFANTFSVTDVPNFGMDIFR